MSEEVQPLPDPDIIPTFRLLEETQWSSKTIGKIAGALAKAQGEMGSVKKTGTNPFYKSKYADINDCLEVALPALSKNGLAISQGNKFSEVSGYFITTTLIHESGEWLRSQIRIPLTNKKDAQEIGSACTYGRRYGLAAMVGLAQVDDDGNATVNNRSIK